MVNQETKKKSFEKRGERMRDRDMRGEMWS